jgi:hypothetical protein
MNNGLDADVSVDASSDSVDLTPNVLTDVFLQSGTAEVFQGFGGDGSGEFDQTLQITAPSATPSSRSLSQNIYVTTYDPTPFDGGSADVTLAGAAPLKFDLGSFTLTVTPTGGSRTNQSSTDIPFSNNATFLLTPAPEPTFGAALIFGAGTLLVRNRRKRAQV